MEFSYTEKKEKTPQALQKSPRRRQKYGSFCGFTHAPNQIR